MYFWGINKKTPRFHHQMKIKFIFLAKLVILILVKDVQLFYDRANYTFSCIKCFIFLFVLYFLHFSFH